jgi:hypothetical protein
VTTVSRQTNADLIRLEHADSLNLSETLKSLLERGEALDRVAQIIERKIDNGTYVSNDPLATLIGHTRFASLYAKTKQQLFPDVWALLNLYKSRYPDPDIEMTLCTRLYKIASNDTDPTRRDIAKGMRDVGTEIALPTLEAILFDHTTNSNVKKMIAEAIESAGVVTAEALLAMFEAKSRTVFVALVSEAIAAIKERAITLKASRLSDEVNRPIPESRNPRPSKATWLLVVDQLSEIELQLHSHIKRRLQERYGTDNDSWWVEGIPLTIRQECAQRRELDRDRQEPFNYTYLLDLKTVLDKNWSLFEPDFAKIRQLVSLKKDFLRQIEEFNVLRNRYAHPIRAPEPDSKASDDDYKRVSEMAGKVAAFCGRATE